MTESKYNCGTCLTVTCDFNPANPDAYYMRDTNEKEVYPGIEVVHEFTVIKGCAAHSDFMAPLLVLEEEIEGGEAKYKQMITASENGLIYTMAAKALNVCLQRIKILKREEL